MSIQQIQEFEDIHKPFREAFLRFVVADYALHYSIKSMAQLNGGVDHIEINIGKNPYSIDVINIGELNRALNRSNFSCINWNNLFSNDPTVCDPEYGRLEEFLKYYFDVDKQFLENCTPKPPTRTNRPTEMKTFSLIQEDNSMSINIEGVIEGNGSAKLIIKNGAGKREYNLISEKIPDKSNVDNYYLYYNESEKQKYKIANHYAYYRTDLFLQGMLSFRIRFPNTRKELVPTTEEQDDEDFSKLEFNMSNEIERMTGTAPPYNVVKLLLRIFGVIFSPLPNENSEKWIVEDLMPAKRNSDLYLHTTTSRMQDVIQDVHPLPPIVHMTDAAGLTSIRDELADLIRSAPAESIDTFGDIISICKSLFDDTSSLSDELRFLDSQLPSLMSRFLASPATTSQQDRTFEARDMVQDFLKKTITKERLSDLHDLIESDSITNRTLYFFRSLNDIIKSKLSSLVKTNANQLWANSSWYDLLPSYRIDLLYVLYWALTSDTRLYKLYEHIRDRTISNPDPYERPTALFPGSLVDQADGFTSLEARYLALKRQLKELDQALPFPGALERLMFAYRGRAI